MPYHLPDFEPPLVGELRELWRAYPQEDVRRLILEIQRYRRVLSEVERLRGVIDRCWKDSAGGQLVALERLRFLLTDESIRVGVLPGR
jgi:hypothetical protein